MERAKEGNKKWTWGRERREETRVILSLSSAPHTDYRGIGEGDGLKGRGERKAGGNKIRVGREKGK